MSMGCGRYASDIALHSMCQPGNPLPHGLSHSICRFLSAGENFHSAKSVTRLFSPMSTRLPACKVFNVEPREIAV